MTTWPTYPELRGRVVVITGGARGIGRASADAFAAQGARLVIADLDLPEAERAVEELGRDGSESVAVALDARSQESARAMVARTLEAFGRLDVLINCAGGYTRIATIAEIEPDEWEAIIALNLTSVYVVSRAAMEPMKAQRFGRIVNFSSQAGRTIVGVTHPAYGTAKAGVIQLTRFLAKELGPHGITVNAIAPSTTLTERVAAFRTPEQIQAAGAETPLGRMSQPDDQAAVTLFLASDSAGFMTGACLDVNGGRIML